MPADTSARRPARRRSRSALAALLRSLPADADPRAVAWLVALLERGQWVRVTTASDRRGTPAAEHG
jgi:hypothetical protein